MLLRRILYRSSSLFKIHHVLKVASFCADLDNYDKDGPNLLFCQLGFRHHGPSSCPALCPYPSSIVILGHESHSWSNALQTVMALLSYYDVMLKRNEKILEWHEKSGPIVCIRPTEVSFASPNLMKEIYGVSGKYAKSEFFDQFVTYGERAVFSIRPSRIHKRKRMAIASFFSKTSISNPIVEDSLRERIEALIKQMDTILIQTPSVDIYPMLNYFAFDNITRLLYGHRHCSYTIDSDYCERNILSGLKQAQLWGPFHFNHPLLYTWVSKFLVFARIHEGFMIAEHQLEAWTHQRVATASADTEWINDYTLLHRMKAAKDIDGNTMSRSYIASDLLDNTNAGQETVTVGLTYVMYHLSQNLGWQKKIREELLALCLPSRMDDYPSFADIDTAPILDSFIHEVYRVNPGASGRAERTVPKGGKVYDGFYLPEGVSSRAPKTLDNDEMWSSNKHLRHASRLPLSLCTAIMTSFRRQRFLTPNDGCSRTRSGCIP